MTMEFKKVLQDSFPTSFDPIAWQSLTTLLISRIILPHDEDISYSGVKRKNSLSVLCIRSKISSETWK
jgi:hypothetical protein